MSAKPLQTCFGLVIVKIPKTNISRPLWPSYCMPKKPHMKMIENALKNYNKFISIRTEALIQLKITTNKGNKLKIETTFK